MKKWMIRIRENLQSNKGFTMVEMVVTIILTGILFTMACTMLLSWGKSYDKLKTIEHAEQLTDTLMDKISGEISGAQDRNIPDHTKGTENLDHVIISADNTEIELYDRTGSHIKISAIESTPGDASTKELNIHYYEVKNLAGDDNLYDAVDWKYSKKMYMNYYVQELRFDTVKGKTGNLLPLVDVTLKVRNEKYQYTCTVTKTIECYNSPTISGPGGGGGTPDPPVPPEEPEINKEHGYIEITDEVIFHEGSPTFEELKEIAHNADSSKPVDIVIPTGIYRDNNRWYWVRKDKTVKSTDCHNMQQVINTGYQEVLELDAKEFVTADDIKNGEFTSNIHPGGLYYHDGKCYVYAGWGPTKDPKDSGWLLIEPLLVLVRN